MSEPDWKARRETRLTNLEGLYPQALGLKAAVGALLIFETSEAYERGLMAGRSQANYPTRRKKKEDSACTATAGGPTPASPTGADEP